MGRQVPIIPALIELKMVLALYVLRTEVAESIRLQDIDKLIAKHLNQSYGFEIETMQQFNRRAASERFLMLRIAVERDDITAQGPISANEVVEVLREIKQSPGQMQEADVTIEGLIKTADDWFGSSGDVVDQVMRDPVRVTMQIKRLIPDEVKAIHKFILSRREHVASSSDNGVTPAEVLQFLEYLVGGSITLKGNTDIKAYVAAALRYYGFDNLRKTTDAKLEAIFLELVFTQTVILPGVVFEDLVREAKQKFRPIDQLIMATTNPEVLSFLFSE